MWGSAGLGDSSALLCAVSSPPAARVGLLERQWQGCERKQKHARAIETWAQNWHKVTSSACFVDQLCPMLCDPVDCSLPGSSVRGILQARMLEWVALSSSRRYS